MFWNKIIKLSKTQKQKLEEYHSVYLKKALNTKPMDKDKATKAAKQLAKWDGLENPKIYYVNNPIDLINIEDSLDNYNLEKKLENIYGRYYDLYNPEHICSVSKMKTTFWDMHKNVETRISNKLKNLIDKKLIYGIERVINNILQDTSTICYFMYCMEVLGISFSKDQHWFLSKKLELIDSCFATRFVQGGIIICERPETFEVSMGSVTNVIWRKS